MSDEELNYLQRQIDSLERKLFYLRPQIAAYGGELQAPVNLLGQRDELEQRLKSLNENRRNLISPDKKLGTPSLRPILRVFIGATPRELEKERQLIEQTLAGLTLGAAQIEVVGSQAVLPEEIEQMVDQQADIYLGLYGSQPGPTASGHYRFVADLEVEAAAKLGRPLLLYNRIGGAVEPEQADFLAHLRSALPATANWRDFETTPQGPLNLQPWVEEDVRRIVAEQPEGPWLRRPPIRQRVLLASLGLAPGAVIGLYHALQRAGQPVSRVVTMAPNNRDVQTAIDICRAEFDGLGIPYRNQPLSKEDIWNDSHAQEFKGVFAALLLDNLENGAEVIVGVTGGRTLMGTLMSTTIQALNLEQVQMVYLSVPEDIEENGRLPQMWDFEHDKAYWKKLLDPGEAASLVRIPYLRYTQ